MTRQRKESKQTGSRSRPDWELLRDSALSIGFDFLKIVERDHMKLQQGNMPRGKFLDKYHGHISEAVFTILQQMYPKVEVVRGKMVVGNSIINSATADDVRVSTTVDYTEPEKPTLALKITAPEAKQTRVAAEVSKLKRKYETGKE
jgi:hypothetical protein